MAELHPPETPINAATITSMAVAAASAATTAAAIPAPADNIYASAANANNDLGPSLAPKRQRRPSVRLGEIGDRPATLSYDSHARRPKPWRFHKHPSLAAKSSKTRPITNLVNGDGHEAVDADDNLDFRNNKSKSKRPITKRARTNWTVASKADNGGGSSSRLDNSFDFRDYDHEGLEDSPLKEHSPVQSVENVALDFWRGRSRVSESRDRDQDQDDELLEEENGSDPKCGTSRDFVRNWLVGLGLGRYSPVFEIHEVDDEVLPLLTLEDLKDMGINAVGSRRKLYSAIQKLRRGFS